MCPWFHEWVPKPILETAEIYIACPLIDTSSCYLFIYLFWEEVLWLVSFQVVQLHYLSCQIYGHQIITFPYFHVSVFKLKWYPFLHCSIGNLWLLFMIIIARCSLILLLFQSSFDVMSVFLFQFHWFMLSFLLFLFLCLCSCFDF